MNELLKARLEVLSIEMETVALLGHTSPRNSAQYVAATERAAELKREIAVLHLNLSQLDPECAIDGEM